MKKSQGAWEMKKKNKANSRAENKSIKNNVQRSVVGGFRKGLSVFAAAVMAVSAVPFYGAAYSYADDSYTKQADQYGIYAESSITAAVKIDYSKNYIVGFKDGISLFNDDDSDVPFSVLDGETLSDVLSEEADAVEWYEEDYEVELYDAEESSASVAAYNPQYDKDKWELEMINADFAYKLNCTGQEIRVGLIDSGVAEHVNLTGKLAEGYNYLESSSDTTDTYGHGTFVSGVLAAESEKYGYEGLAPDVQIVPLKCFNGKTTISSVICKALYGAVDDYDCDIVNMSIGIKSSSKAMKDAIEHAEEEGVIVVAAVGNENSAALRYPAAYGSVIGVGAVESTGERWGASGGSKGSQYNSSVFVTAPGANVTSLSCKGGYTTGTGTSYAAPYVTAAVAVMKSVEPGLTLDEVKDIISTSAEDKGDEGYDTEYGYGILDVEGCLKELIDDDIYVSYVEIEAAEDTAEDGAEVTASDAADTLGSFNTAQEVTETLVVYNNTKSEFSGVLMSGSYGYSDDTNIMKKMRQTELTIPSDSSVKVVLQGKKNGLTTYNLDTERYVVWKSIDKNSIISNLRGIYLSLIEGELSYEPSGEQTVLTVDLSDRKAGSQFSLTIKSSRKDSSAASGGEASEQLLYAASDYVPESGSYAVAVPLSALSTEDGSELSCVVTINTIIDGESVSRPAKAHNYETTELVEPTETEKGYTKYLCSGCGDEYTEELDAFGYTVSYDMNGGDAALAPASQNKQPGETLILSDVIPERAGYEFVGWSPDSTAVPPEDDTEGTDATDGTDGAEEGSAAGDGAVIYKPGDEYTADASVTLYAVWKANTYELTYIVDNEIYKTVKIKCGESIAAETAPAKSGYRFVEWTGLPQTMPAGDLTVTAKYTAASSGGGGGGGGGGSSSSAGTTDTENKDTDVKPGDSEDDPIAELLSFTDVDSGSWYSAGVSYAVENGLMNGVTGTRFAPDAGLTRAMFVTILYRAAGGAAEGQNIASAGFTDVSSGAYYSDAVDWAAASGIVKGISTDKFGPDILITREQLASMTYRFAEHMGTDLKTSQSDADFADAGDISAFAREAVSWASEAGLLTGYDNGCFYPARTTTRAQIAVLLMRMHDKSII